MKRKKEYGGRVMIIFLIMSILLGITGCSNMTSGEITATRLRIVEGLETDEVGEIILKFPCIWVGNDSKANMVAELIKEFNQKHSGNIRVDVEEITDYEAYTEMMRMNAASGNLPDIFTFRHGAEAAQFFRSGKLMDLTPYMEDGWNKNFLDDAIEMVRYGGNILAVPFEFGVTPVMYNSRLFRKAGINEFPKTYNEFFEAAEKLKEAGIIPMSQMTGANAWTSMLWYSQIVVSIGGPDVYRRGLDDPAFLEAAKVLKRMFDYTTSDAIGATAGDAGGHFLNENTAMLMNGPWYIGRLRNDGANNMYDEVQIASAPYYEGGQGEPGGYIGFIQANIAAGKQESKRREDAVITFLKFFTDPQNVKRISMDSGAMFVIKFDADAGDQIERLQAQMIQQLNAAPYAIPHFAVSMPPAVSNEFPNALSNLVLGRIDAEEFIEWLKAVE